jgi:CRISPR/Cas system-associated exonuclease Cas4 (RecB family)
MVVSQSSIKLYKKCPQAYYYKKVMNIVPKRSALPLQRGIILHSALEAYYKKEDWRAAIAGYQEFWDSLMEEEQMELYGGDLLGDCTKIIEGYCRVYGKKPKEKVLAVELDLSEKPIEILPGLYLSGRIDLISKDENGTWITEHKSHKKIPSEDTRFLNTQTVLYQLAAEKLGFKLDGIRWNYLRTKLPTIPRQLKAGGLSRAKDIDTDYYTYYNAIIENGEDPKDYQEELTRLKESGNDFYVRRYSPKNEQVTQAILSDLRNVAPLMERMDKYPYRCLDPFTCRSCSYKTLCQAELLGLDTSFILKKDFMRKEENDETIIEEDEAEE